ncbi:hypothetical protein [Gluconobacter oxydans]|uniref:hypothetical protein n=1 Tax=Gluconobacter oxydans TaxID=442 RepID=UPI001558C0E2|nr:hypothetical protein [Gluconobacter oxydans]
MSESSNGTPEARTGYVVSDLVSMALEQLGVGVGNQNADPQGMASGVKHLNMMLAQWQRRRWLVPNLVDTAFQSSGASVYYFGPGGDLDIPVRPDRIEAVYARMLNGAAQSTEGDFAPSDFTPSDFDTGNDGLGGPGQPIDFGLTIIESYEDYASLGLKALRAWPSFCHYNPSFPLGEFRPWPIPPEGWEFHVLYKVLLPANLSASSPINLPPEYWDAIMWTLAARLAPSYGQEASPTVVASAKSALNTIRTSNTQVPILGMPSILTPSGNPVWWPGLEIQKL